MTDKPQMDITEIEKAARNAAFDAIKNLMHRDPKASLLLARSLAAGLAKAARTMAENDALGVAANYFHFRDLEQAFFSDGWDSDHSVEAYAGVLAHMVVFRLFYHFLLEEALRSLVAEGLLVENDSICDITDAGRRFREGQREEGQRKQKRR